MKGMEKKVGRESRSTMVGASNFRKVWLIVATLVSCLVAQAALPESGDRVVIDDFEYVLVRAGDWGMVTSQVAQCMAAYEKMNGTEEGRVAIHGRRGHTTITNGTITVEYADGWKRTETVAANARPRGTRGEDSKRTTARVGAGDSKRTTARVGAGDSKRTTARVGAKAATLPSKLAEIMARRAAAKATTNEVTVTVGGGK